LRSHWGKKITERDMKALQSGKAAATAGATKAPVDNTDDL
jgi:hypothetical protein